MFVLSGPPTEIINVATASVLLAEGWSTESVTRVVRTARTRQEKHEKERAEHAYYSHKNDEVTISDVFSPQVRDSRKMKISQTTQQHRMTRKMKQNSPHPTHCKHGDRFRRSDQIARWYECDVLVEPSADSSWQPPSTAVVLVRHRNVQLVQS